MPRAIQPSFLALAFALAAGIVSTRPAEAQLNRGFSTTVEPAASGEELNHQYDLWAMEVDYKPVRMLWVDLTDPKTGRKSRELIWYLVYRAVNRDLERPPDTSDTAPVNDEDPLPLPYFIPEFTLMTNDNSGSKIYEDVILPDAQRAISQRERQALRNSVEIVTELSKPPVLRGDEIEEQQALYGVAMWRGVDPETDRFSIFFTGFSNGYLPGTGPDGELFFGRRTIRQDYWRPGDRFFEIETEIRPDPDNQEPVWLYRPDASQPGTSPVPPAAPPQPPQPPAQP